MDRFDKQERLRKEKVRAKQYDKFLKEESEIDRVLSLNRSKEPLSEEYFSGIVQSLY